MPARVDRRYSTAMHSLLDDVMNGIETLEGMNPRQPGYVELAHGMWARAYLVVTALAVRPAVTAVTVTTSVAASC